MDIFTFSFVSTEVAAMVGREGKLLGNWMGSVASSRTYTRLAWQIKTSLSVLGSILGPVKSDSVANVSQPLRCFFSTVSPRR